jgi:hypothetical protein
MRLVHSEIDPMHNAGDNAGRKPVCAEDIAERQNLSDGCLPVAILAMTRWITAPVKALDDAGFHRSAAALVLHQGRADQTRDHEAELAQLRRHSFCHAAQVRGAERCGCRDYMIDKGRAPQPMSSRCAAIGRPVPCVGSMSSPPRRSQTYDQRMKVETIVSEWPMSVQYLPLSRIDPAALFFTANQWTLALDGD